MAWAVIGPSRLASVPYELTFSAASSDAPPEVLGFGVDAAKLERLEIRAPGVNNPIATALVMRDLDGRLVPLTWLNAVTDPVFFSDMSAAEAFKVLTAIKEHVPSEAVILSWWDLSRRIRTIVQRQAPLDDPFARGLLTPSAWSSKEDVVQKRQTNLWGVGVPAEDGAVFTKFVDALLLDEDRGMEALAQIAGGKQAYIAVQLSDIWKAAAVHPDLISIGYRDFPKANGSHGVINAVHQWIEEQKIEGGYAIEPIGSAVRLHYLRRKPDSQLLLTRLLPFSTSNPLRLNRLRLVYQYKGCWIYELARSRGSASE